MSSQYLQLTKEKGADIGCRPVFLVGELIASRSGRIQPLTAPSATALAVVVMVIIHLHVAAVGATIGTAGTAGELDLLVRLDRFLYIDLFHSIFPFKVEICPAIPCW